MKPPEQPEHAPMKPVPFAPGTWLQTPSLSDRCGDLLRSVGPTFHRPAIELAIERFGELVTADLRIEEQGQFAGAVRVFVAGEQVASVPELQADRYRAVIRELTDQGRACTCHARLGVAPAADGKHWLKVLLCGLPQARPAGAPFLPGIGDPVMVRLSDVGRAYCTAGHSDKPYAHSEYVAVLANTRGSTWVVVADGNEIGELSLRSRGEWLREADEAGLPLTACLFSVGSKDSRPSLRAYVEIPGDDDFRHVFTESPVAAGATVEVDLRNFDGLTRRPDPE